VLTAVAQSLQSHVLLHGARWLVNFTLLVRVQLIVIRVRRGGTGTSVTGYCLDSRGWAGYIRKYGDSGLMPVNGRESTASNTSRCTLGPTQLFESCRVEWCRTLTSVLILRLHGSIPPLHSDSSGIVPSVWSIYYQQFLHDYQHFILEVFSYICWQEMNCDWNTVEISAVISKLMKYILQPSFILRRKGSNFIQ